MSAHRAERVSLRGCPLPWFRSVNVRSCVPPGKPWPCSDASRSQGCAGQTPLFTGVRRDPPRQLYRYPTARISVVVIAPVSPGCLGIGEHRVIVRPPLHLQGAHSRQDRLRHSTACGQLCPGEGTAGACRILVRPAFRRERTLPVAWCSAGGHRPSRKIVPGMSPGRAAVRLRVGPIDCQLLCVDGLSLRPCGHWQLYGVKV